MKVTRQILHKELQPYYYRASAIKLMFLYKWLTRLINATLVRSFQGKNIEGLRCTETHIASSDGKHQIRTRIYRPKNHDNTLPVMLYCHGGGYITGNPEHTDSIIERYIDTRPCIVVAPDYRKSYTQPYPAGFNDCYDTLLWIRQHATEFGGCPEKIMVAGNSAGGGLTAAVTLKARDTGDANIAFQMPMYPMIDDTQPNDSSRQLQAPVWDSRTNRIGWNAYLADLHKSGAEIPTYAAPARNSDYRNFPPTITLVGTLDPFHDEVCRYVEALRSEGIETAFEEYDGCFHGFEQGWPELEVSKAALNFTYNRFADFYDRYAARP